MNKTTDTQPINSTGMTPLETLLAAKRLGKCLLIKRKSKGATKPSWSLAKVTSIDAEKGTFKVVEFKKLNLAGIEDAKFPNGGEDKV
jgi:hypothetical protein